MYIRIVHSKIGKISWKTVILWLRMNELYLHAHSTRWLFDLLDKLLNVRRQ